MEIIHLLEVLNPLKNVVTLKVDNDKDLFSTISEFLIAIAPALIAGIAMWYSYKQFKISLQNQSEQFRLGLKQQIHTLKINTQLATEVELIKDECKMLREVFVDYLDCTSFLFKNHFEYKQYSDNTGSFSTESRNKAYENIILYNNKALQKRMMLLSYLNLDIPEEKTFFDCIVDILNCATNADTTGGDLGTLQGRGAHLCFELIKKKRQAILSLAETITD